MKKCLKCNIDIPCKVKIDNIVHNISNRKYCLVCSPFKKHNTKQLHIISNKNMIKICPKCQKEYTNDFFYRRRNNTNLSVYCKSCTTEHTISRQKKFKILCVNYKGGKCIKCGYDKYVEALEFHHIDPSKKEFCIAKYKLWKFDEIIKNELDKCLLLCRNCHAEEHVKMRNQNYIPNN